MVTLNYHQNRTNSNDLQNPVTKHAATYCRKGFSTSTLRYFRQFYLAYANRPAEIRQPSGGELPLNQKRHPKDGESAEGFHPALGWSHYRALMCVEDQQVRSFYEIESGLRSLIKSGPRGCGDGGGKGPDQGEPVKVRQVPYSVTEA